MYAPTGHTHETYNLLSDIKRVSLRVLSDVLYIYCAVQILHTKYIRIQMAHK